MKFPLLIVVVGGVIAAGATGRGTAGGGVTGTIGVVGSGVQRIPFFGVAGVLGNFDVRGVRPAGAGAGIGFGAGAGGTFGLFFGAGAGAPPGDGNAPTVEPMPEADPPGGIAGAGGGGNIGAVGGLNLDVSFLIVDFNVAICILIVVAFWAVVYLLELRKLTVLMTL